MSSLTNTKILVKNRYQTRYRYAHRAKSIQNSVKCNEDVNEKVIRELKEEIEKLRQQLLQGGGGGGGGGDNEEAAVLQVRQARLAVRRGCHAPGNTTPVPATGLQ